ncbi:MAG: prepilin-type N-terminal cleavage/methylation domain-containing protein [Victivallaceae bacterium]|nr:prepilin-type N-terminal cleavage/methylation domain-containing protein [Victivallaceae bacterium]
MKNRFNKHTGNIIIRPYSLVEMLVVIAIIAILAGIGAGGYTVARRWLSQSRTEALLAKLKIAIESYKNDKGYYPLPHIDPTSELNNPENVPCFRLDANNKDYDADVSNPMPTDPEYIPRNNMNNFVDYSKIQQDQSLLVNVGRWSYYYVKDGWNAPIIVAHRAMLIDGNRSEFGAIKYRCPGLINRTSFDLYSAGHDREFAVDPATDIEDDIYAE